MTRVALVTGSGKRRLGWHIADALAQRGYTIALHYNRSAADVLERVAELRQRGNQAQAWQAALADEQAVRSMIAGVQQAFGRIDVLVNCAAIWRPKPLESTTAADLREHWEANTLGTFLCAQHAGLAMCAQPAGGVIVNVGDWATRRPYRNYAAYFASKGAIPTITRMLAVELSSRNPQVRVSAILPGPVMLPDDLPAAERQQAIDATLLRRAGAPANVVQGVLYLIDNDFVTGDCLTIDGGRSISG